MLARQKSDSGERAAGNAGDIQISSNAVFGGFRVAATSERFADKPAQWVVRVSARQSTVVRFDDMSIHVAVLGGGVAGLSAAHELIERGFRVSVYEAKNVFGGKARSLSVPGTGAGGRKDLPGEHGFRFFPAFYRHLPDTMMRIPFPGNVSVFNNLVHATRIEVARAGSPALILTARVPQNIEDWAVAFKEVFRGIGVADNEVLFFVDRLFTLLTSCPERRIAEYEQIPWWTFIDAATHSAAFQTLLGKGLTRSLVAVRAQEGSTRTVGYILLQLLFGLLTSGGFDRLLNGPTTEVWLTNIGIRSVEFSIPWNWHQLAPGDFDFSGRTSPRRDLLGLIRILRRLGLNAWVRSAEPVDGWRNLGVPGGADAGARRAWLKQLSDILATQTASHGGPVAWGEGAALEIDAAAPPVAVRISAGDPAALALSRQALATGKSVLWTGVEDRLYQIGR